MLNTIQITTTYTKLKILIKLNSEFYLRRHNSYNIYYQNMTITVLHIVRFIPK